MKMIIAAMVGFVVITVGGLVIHKAIKQQRDKAGMQQSIKDLDKLLCDTARANNIDRSAWPEHCK